MTGVNIYPFQGIRFARESGDTESLVAPPYDVFDYQDSLYHFLKEQKNNIVNIQKPEGEGDNKYLNASQILTEWMDQGIMRQDDQAYYYIYEQESEFGVRRGVIAAVDVDETYQKIRRHEKIKSGPKIDRYKLTLATGCNIGLIFSIFNDPNGQVASYLQKICAETKPEYDFVWPAKKISGWESKQVRNRLYVVADQNLQEMLENTVLYIADGHHRYQTMVEYKKKMEALYGTDEQANYRKTMMYVAPDSGLLVLGYHRVVKGLDQQLFVGFMDAISEDFEILERVPGQVLEPKQKGYFGIYFDNTGYLVTPKNLQKDKLDTELLQELILEKRLSMTDEMAKSGKYITYPNGEQKMTMISDLVDNKDHQAGFVLFPTGVDELMKVADENRVLPQKSTYFFPKLLTGLVLNRVAPMQQDLNT